MPHDDTRQRQRLPDLPLGRKSECANFHQQVQASSCLRAVKRRDFEFVRDGVTMCNSAVNVVLPGQGDNDPKEEAIPEQCVLTFTIQLFCSSMFQIALVQVRQRHQGWQVDNGACRARWRVGAPPPKVPLLAVHFSSNVGRCWFSPSVFCC